MKSEYLDVLKKIRLGGNHQLIHIDDKELYDILLKLSNLDVLILEKNAYRVKNSKLLRIFIRTPDFETLVSFIER
jgi:hypothetical protein